MNIRTRKLIASITTLTYVFSLFAQAQIIADPNAHKNYRPHVINSANGTPVINIQRPTQGGISVNHYQQFNINQQGAILNNSRGRVNTQLGGMIQGNDWLAGEHAKAIVNQVNGQNPSHLNGFIEVAGQRADVIIANPSGININGAGFINAGNVTITTGVPIIQDGVLNRFEIRGGQVNIMGAGLNNSYVDYTQILSEVVNIQAGIWANDLEIVTGTFDRDHKGGITKREKAGEKPKVGIDTGALGGMYAGKIKLVSTDKGVGVNNEGQMAATNGGFTLSADGKIVNKGSIVAQNKQVPKKATVKIKAQAIENRGSISSQGQQVLTAQDIKNFGLIVSSQELVVSSQQSIINHTDAEMRGARLAIRSEQLKNAGKLTQVGTQDLVITAEKLENTHKGSIGAVVVSDPTSTDPTPPTNTEIAPPTNNGSGAGGNIVVDQGSSNSEAPLVWSAGEIAVKDIINDGGAIIGNGIDLTVTNSLVNDDSALYLNNLVVTGQTLNNQQGRINATTATVNVQQLVNTAGYIGVVNDFTMTAQQIINNDNAVIYAAKNSDITFTQLMDNSQGTVFATGSLALKQQDLQQGGLINSGGIISAGKDLTLASHSLMGAGDIIAQNTLDIQVYGDYLLEGTMSGQSIQLGAQGSLTNEGEIKAVAGITITAVAIDNTLVGKILANGGIQLSATEGDFTNHGQVETGHGLTIRANSIKNSAGGQILAVDDAQLSANKGAFINNGEFQVGKGLAINAQGVLTGKNSQLIAGGALVVNANGSAINLDGVIQANAIALSTQAGLINSGEMLSVEGITIDAASVANDPLGKILANGSIYLSANKGDFSNRGQLEAGGDLAIRANSITHGTTGSILAVGDAQLTAKTGGFNSDGQLQVGKNLTIDAHGASIGKNGKTIAGRTLTLNANDETLTQLGIMQANDITLSTQQNFVNGGEILSIEGVSIVASSIDNNASGKILANGNIQLSATDGDFSNHGQLETGGNLDIIANGIENSATGKILAVGDAQFTAHTDAFTHTGELQVGKDLTIDAHGVLTGKDSQLIAGGMLNIQGNNNAINLDGAMQANAIALSMQEGLINNGEMLAVDGITIDATSITNDTLGKILANGNIYLSANKGDFSNYGQLEAGGDLNITANGIINSDTGKILAVGVAQLTANTGAFTHMGELQVGQALNIDAHGILTGKDSQLIAGGALNIQGNNSAINLGGTMQANHITLSTQQSFINNGEMLSVEGITIDALSIDNGVLGKILANGNIQLSANKGDFNNHGQLEAGGNLVITANSITNSATGKILAVGDAQLTAHTGAFIHAGQLQVGKDLTINAQGVLTGKDSQLIAGGALNIQGNNSAINLGGVMQANNIILSTQESLINNGEILSVEGIKINAASIDNGMLGKILANGNIQLRANKGDFSNHGQLEVGGNLDITANSITNSANILAVGDTQLVAKTGGFSNDGQLQVGKDLTINAHGVLTGKDSQLIAGGALNIQGNNSAINLAGVMQANNIVLSTQEGLINNGEMLSVEGIAIDAASITNDTLGKILANGNIQLRANKGDFSNDGQLEAGGNLDITANGIENSATGKIIALGDAQLTAHTGAFIHAGQLQVGKNLTIDAHGASLGKDGKIIAGGTLTLNANDETLTQLGIMQANHITLSTQQNFVNGGEILSIEGVSIVASSINNNTSGKILANGNIQLSANDGDFSNHGQLEAGGDLNITANGIENSDTGKILAVGDAQLTANTGSLIHAGQLQVGKDLTIDAHGALTGKDSQLIAGGMLNIQGNNRTINLAGVMQANAIALSTQEGLINNGEMLAVEGITIDVASITNDTLGKILANDRIYLSANDGDFSNHGQLEAGGDLNITANGITNSDTGKILVVGDATLTAHTGAFTHMGELQVGQALTIASQGVMTDSGSKIIAGGALNLQANTGAIDLQGTMQANNIILSTQEGLINNGEMLSVEGITIDALSIDNGVLGKILTNGHIQLSANDGDFTNNGQVEAGGNLEVTANRISNSANILAVGYATLTANTGTFNNAGQLQVGQALTVASQGVTTSSGSTISAGESLNLQANAGAIDLQGTIQANTITLSAGQGVTNNGEMLAVESITIDAASIDNGVLGKILANGNIQLSANDGDFTNNGQVEAGSKLEITANSITNSAGGTILAVGDTKLIANTGAFTHKGELQVGKDLTINAQGISTHQNSKLLAGGHLSLQANSGTIDHQGLLQAKNIAFSTQEDFINQGEILAVEGITITAASIDNSTQGKILGNGNIQLSANKGNFNNHGQLEAGGNLAITANSITNSAVANILAVGDAALTATTGALTNLSQIQVGGSLAIDAHGFLTDQASKFVSGGTFSLDNHDVAIDHQGVIQANNIELNTLTDFTNHGALLSVEGISINASSISNSIVGKILANGNIYLSANDGDFSNHGQLEAGGTLGISANRITNSVTGKILAVGDATLTAKTGALTNLSQIQVGGSVAIDAHGLLTGEASKFVSGGTFNLNNHDVAINHQGVLQANSIQLNTEAAFTNQGELLSVEGITINASSIENEALGKILANGNVYLTATGGDFHNKGQVEAGRLAITANSITNHQNANILVLGDATLTSKVGGLTNQSQIQVGESLTIDAHGVYSSTDSKLIAGGTLTMNSHDVALDHQGLMQAKNIELTTQQRVNNLGEILAVEGINITASAIDNSTSGKIIANGDIGLTANHGDFNNHGQLEAGGRLDISANGITNHNGGTILVVGDGTFTSSTGAFTNLSQIQVGQSLTLDAQGITMGTGAQLLVGKDLTINTHDKDLLNLGHLQAGNDLSITASQLMNQEGGQVLSGRDLTINAQNIKNSGSIESGNDLSIHTQYLNNHETGRIVAGNSLDITANGLANRGELNSNNLTLIKADSVYNIGTGVIYGDHVAIEADTLVNQEGYNSQGELKAAVIGAREHLSLGVKNIINQEDALLLSGNTLMIGGQLNENNIAIGNANSLLNSSARIEAMGDAKIAVNKLDNLNNHFVTTMNLSQPTEQTTIGQSFTLIPGAADKLVFEGSEEFKQRILSGEELVTGNCFADPTVYCTNYDKGKKSYRMYDAQGNSVDADAWVLKWHVISKYEEELISSKPGEIIVGGSLIAEGDHWTNKDSKIIVGGNFIGSLNQFDNKETYKNIVVTDSGGQVLYTPPNGQNTITEGPSTPFWYSWESQEQFRDSPFVFEQNASIVAQDKPTDAQLNELTQENLNHGQVGATTGPEGSDIKGESITGQTVNNGQNVTTEGVTGDQTVATEGVNGGQTVATENVNGGQSITTEGVNGDQTVVAERVQDEQTITAEGVNGDQTVMAERVQGEQTFNAEGVTGAQNTVATDVKGDQNIHAETIQGGQNTIATDVTNGDQILADLQKNTDAPTNVIKTLPEFNPQLPNSSLFTINPNGHNYLIETDSRFTNSKEWLNSDYMLKQLMLGNMHKRLGDGYYEQRLINEQINQLTGYRRLGGYSSDEEQFKALMTAGVTVATTLNLIPGVALTPEQAAQLTSDIIWMVSEQVTLPDGSVETVLVPKVYVVVREGDLSPTGALVSADNVQLKLGNQLNNEGTLQGQNVVMVEGNHIVNSGVLAGDKVSLTAENNVDIIGGVVIADNYLSIKGNEVNVITTTATTGDQANGNTSIDRVAGLYVTNQSAGLLSVEATQDINLQGAVISNVAREGTTQLVAKEGSVNIGTVTVAHNEATGDGQHFYNERTTTEVGSSIDVVNKLLVKAGDSVNIIGSDLNSQLGDVVIHATNNVNIVEGRATSDVELGASYASKKLFSKKSGTFNFSESTNEAIGSNITGNRVQITADNDVVIRGSSVISDVSTVISAQNNLTISAAENYYQDKTDSNQKKSGLMSAGKTGFMVGSQRGNTAETNEQLVHTGSTVGSLVGNTTLVAGNTYTQHGSTVASPMGDVLIKAKEVNIVAAEDSYRSDSSHSFKSSGLTVAINVPVVDRVNDAKDSVNTVGKSKNDRVNAMAVANGGWNAYQAGNEASKLLSGPDSIVKDPTNIKNAVSASITVGSQKSSSASHLEGTNTSSSSVSAGGSVVIQATGGGQNSNINIIGSDVAGGKGTHLMADNNVNILAQGEYQQERNDNKSSGWNAGLTVSAKGVGITVGGNKGKGHGNGDDVTYRPSHVGDLTSQTTITSGGTTNIIGSQVFGDGVQIDAKELNVVSLQETATYDGKQQNVSGSITIGAGVSGSAGYSKSDIKSDYQSVNDQAGIYAGDKGFDIKVAGNTNLIGAIITSTDKAEAAGKNSLSTGTITVADLDNHSSYKGEAVSIAGGFTLGDSKNPQKDNVSTSDLTLPNLTGPGISQSVGYGKDKGSSSSTTESGIFTENITITHKDQQQILTGKTVEETIAGLKTDLNTDQALEYQGLENIFDKNKVQKELDLQIEVTQQFSKNLQEMKLEINKKIDATNDPKEKENWQLVGKIVNVIGAGLYAPSESLGGSLVAAASPELANQIGNYFNGLRDKDGNLALKDDIAHKLAHGILGAAVAGATGSDVTNGFLAGAGAEVLGETVAKWLYPDAKDPSTLTADEKNLISSIVGLGLAVGDGAIDVATGNLIGTNAVENNFLGIKQSNEFAKEVEVGCTANASKCAEILDKWHSLSLKQSGLSEKEAEDWQQGVSNIFEPLYDKCGGDTNCLNYVAQQEIRANIVNLGSKEDLLFTVRNTTMAVNTQQGNWGSVALDVISDMGSITGSLAVGPAGKLVQSITDKISKLKHGNSNFTDLAKMYDNKNIPVTDFEIKIGGKTYKPDPIKTDPTKGTPIYSGLSDKQVYEYFAHLTGGAKIKTTVTPKGTVYNAKLADGTILNLRDFSNSTGKWTIDIQRNPNIKNNVEIKFD